MIVLTCLVHWALVVGLTFALNTFHIRVAEESSWTFTSEASGWIGFWCTFSSRSTGVGVAWIRCLNAHLVFTHISTIAVRISRTFRAATSYGVRFGHKFSKTSANGVSKFISHTHCSGAARRWIAWVWLFYTPLIIADISGLAIWISNAFRPTSSYGIGFGNKTRITSTNGIAKAIDTASCARSTGRWVTWIRLFHTFLILTNISLLAIRVSDAFWFTASDRVRIRNQSRLTSANWISNAVHRTSCTRTTW